MQLQPELLITAFALSGITLKTSDFLGERGSTPISYLSAAVSAFIFGLLMSESVFSSSLILGIIIGVILSRKVDRPNMVLGLILTFAFASYFEFWTNLKVSTLWFLVVVAFFTFIDEVGHERLGQKEGFPALFFRYRLSLKLIMILLAGVSLIPTVYLIGFLCFDLAYDFTNHFLTNIKSKPLKH